MIRSVVDRPPPPIVQRLPNDDQASQGRHISHVNCGTCNYVLMMLLRSVMEYFFYFPPGCINWCAAAVMINCPCGGIHHPSTVMTDVIMGGCWCNPIKRYDSVLMCWLWGEVILCGEDVFTIKLLHWNINHTSVVTEANNFFPLFSSLDLKHFHVLSILKRF